VAIFSGAGLAAPLAKHWRAEGQIRNRLSQANYAEPYRQHVNNDLIELAKAIRNSNCRSPTAPATTTRRPHRLIISSPRASTCLMISPFEAAR